MTMARLLLVVSAVVAVGAGLAFAQEKTARTLQIEGSTTVGPLADAFAEYFQKNNAGLEITVKKTGSGDGAAALIDGRAQIATMSRFMKVDEFKNAIANNVMPVAHAIAMDAVCVIVNPSNLVKALTAEQIRDIYTGKIDNWKQVGGADMPIVIISRDTSSGTYEIFNEKVLKKEKVAARAEYVNANPQAYNRVATTAGAIGYVGLGFVDDKVRAVDVNGFSPSRKTVLSGEYLISRPLFLFTNGYPATGSLVQQFCTFYLTEKGQQIVEAKGFVPFTSY